MDYSQLKQLEDKNIIPNIEPMTIVAVIVKVKQAKYCPDSLELRMQIDDYMFTAQCEYQEVEKIKQDPLVQSMEMSKILFLNSK